VGSWAPFNSTPTHYRVSIDGEAKWFGQCGPEINAIRWLVPGRKSSSRRVILRLLEDWAAVFSIDLFRRRFDSDYLSKMADYRGQMREVLQERGMTGAWFFRPR
jgi:hypothetical protein